jgi:anti-sigma factor RsiW
MREFCLTEEVIQQFVDGELSKEQTESAAAHLAACDECAGLLDGVEQENELLTEAFAPELSLPVPTAALRERIDAAIAELAPRPKVAGESAGSRVRNWFGSLFGSLSFTPQQVFGFASLAVVVAFAGIFAVTQLRHAQPSPTTQAGTKIPSTAQPGSSPVTGTPQPEPPQIANVSATPGVKPEIRTVRRPDAGRRRLEQVGNAVATNVVPKNEQSPIKPATTTTLLPGEKGYLEAIASLTTAIETNKDDVLKPAVRADYERNLAVVDQAIATTRMQAKRNPKDRDAAEFMYTAYQNKVELLSAVADQTRIASR